MIKSSFSGSGVLDESGTTNYSYLYGLSDFWETMFEDPGKITSILDASTLTCSEIYSNFLQITSSLSLESVQEVTGSQIKLVLLGENSKVSGSHLYEYSVLSPIKSAARISNRPFLPTISLEEGTDYFVDFEAGTIIFAKDPFTLGFPSRRLSSGETQISIWATDVEIDERLLYKHYARLINLPDVPSTEQYKDFIYGMFFLYTHGPDLALVRKGLNLSLGIPMTRTSETVLDMRLHTDSDTWIVVTDRDEYKIPYGLPPMVEIGQVLAPLSELATWVEVRDFVQDGDWWINLQLPKSLLPNTPAGQTSRYATKDSYAYELMDKYLKHHTFLVKVNVSFFQNIQTYKSIASVIREIKPAHTAPIYIWAVPLDKEVLSMSDDSFSYSVAGHFCDRQWDTSAVFRRDSSTPHRRGHPEFLRCSISARTLSSICNVDTEGRYIDAGVVSGYINKNSQFDNKVANGYDKNWIATLINRGERSFRAPRGHVFFNPSQLDLPSYRPAVYAFDEDYDYEGTRSVPLYITTNADVKQKLESLNIPYDRSHWTISVGRRIMATSSVIDGRPTNVGTLNGSGIHEEDLLVTHYDTLFFKGPRGHTLGHNIPPAGIDYAYAPVKSAIVETDYILFKRISGEAFGVYWMTSLQDPSIPVMIPYTENDSLTGSFSAKISRGLGPGTDNPYYLLRGDSVVAYTDSNAMLNGVSVNDRAEATSTLASKFRNVSIDRSGITLPHPLSNSYIAQREPT